MHDTEAPTMTDRERAQLVTIICRKVYGDAPSTRLIVTKETP